MLRKRGRSPSDLILEKGHIRGPSSTTKPSIVLFLFRRDLRIEDNISFYHVLSAVNMQHAPSLPTNNNNNFPPQGSAGLLGLPILPCFFFLPRQANPRSNPYFSHASFTFLKQSLVDLNGAQQLDGHLAVFRASSPLSLKSPPRSPTKQKMTATKQQAAEPASLIDGEKELLEAIGEHFHIAGLGFSPGDYTPFARRRDAQLCEFCEANGIVVVQPSPNNARAASTTASNNNNKTSFLAPPFRSEYSLLPLDAVRTGQGKSYSVFTPFYKRFLDGNFDREVPKPLSLRDFVTTLKSSTAMEAADDSMAWVKSQLLHPERWPEELFARYGVVRPHTKKTNSNPNNNAAIAEFSYESPNKEGEGGRQEQPTAPIVRGGRTAALLRLHVAMPKLRSYESSRNELPVPFDDEAALLSLSESSPTTKQQQPQHLLINDSTTLLSPYMKFGCVSVREVFHTAVAHFGRSSVLVKELLWREFFAVQVWTQPSLLHGQLHAPGLALCQGKSSLYASAETATTTTAPVLLDTHNQPFQELYQPFVWRWDDKDAQRFFEGRTEIPLVDAAIRCLRTTGFCPNRLRMVIAIVATKMFGIDWRVCEQFYASYAVDYDPASNSGGWQWASGQGADALPYFRTMNPFLQSAKFDREAKFIKHFVPEVRNKSAKELHDAESDVGKALRVKAKTMKEAFEQFRASQLR